MPKLKKQLKQNPKTDIQEFLNKYESRSLNGALSSFEDSLGWDLLKAFLYHQASFHAGMSILLSQETGHQFEAASAGAKAEVLRQVAESFVEDLRNKVSGNNGVVESPMPEEETASRA